MELGKSTNWNSRCCLFYLRVTKNGRQTNTHLEKLDVKVVVKGRKVAIHKCSWHRLRHVLRGVNGGG